MGAGGDKTKEGLRQAQGKPLRQVQDKQAQGKQPQDRRLRSVNRAPGRRKPEVVAIRPLNGKAAVEALAVAGVASIRT